MLINLLYDAQAQAPPQSFRDGMQIAANLLRAAFHNNITLNIAVGYGELVPGGTYLSYSTLRQDLINTASSADDTTSVAWLPNTSSFQGQSSFYIADAQLKAFGATAYGADDGGVGMGTSFTGNVLISGALHEITHAMGRVAGSSLDLFRYNEDRSGNHVFGGAIPSTPAYFSINGGTTDLGRLRHKFGSWRLSQQRCPGIERSLR